VDTDAEGLSMRVKIEGHVAVIERGIAGVDGGVMVRADEGHIFKDVLATPA
jgi:hypothetical protein